MATSPATSPSPPTTVIRSVDASDDPLLSSVKQLVRDFLVLLKQLDVDMEYQAVEDDLAARQRRTTPLTSVTTPQRTLLSPSSPSPHVCRAWYPVVSPCCVVPGKFGRPSRGCVLVAVDDSTSPPTPMGCVMLKRMEDGSGEVKRLFVDQRWRRYGVARLLMQRLLREAVELGYDTLRLDTLRRLDGTTAFYQSVGFHSIPAYCFNPCPDALFFEVDLTQQKQAH
jgi:predicted N-acetyltransferase YhbS